MIGSLSMNFLTLITGTLYVKAPATAIFVPRRAYQETPFDVRPKPR
jgi:hypothetical protein